MGVPLEITRADHTSAELRALSGRCADSGQVRRMLALALVMDNLSTHSAGALYDAFPAPEARRVLKRLQFHHTPKHASWLNMVEIEIGVLRSQCLDRRIDDK